MLTVFPQTAFQQTLLTRRFRRLVFRGAMLLLLLASPAFAAVTLAAESGELRVMSFNIRFGTANDGENKWPARRELVVETIKRYTPDLLGTQETLPFQASYIGQQLPEYTYVGWSRDANPDGEQCGIFYLSERFEQLDAGQFWLSENPAEKFSKSWDSSLPRVATWVVLKDRRAADAEPLFFLNTHFDHRGQVARLEAAKLILQQVNELRGDKPVIITGDFNCDQGSAPYQAITSDGLLVDTYRARYPEKQENEGTFNGFKGTAGNARIDWVLASKPLVVREATIDRYHVEQRYPSDHFPVTAILSRNVSTAGE